MSEQQNRLGPRIAPVQDRDERAVLRPLGRRQDARRARIASAACVQLPTERVVLISISSL
jgi:hypothetical protein